MSNKAAPNRTPPAFPSNMARIGALYRVFFPSLSAGAAWEVYLMACGIASLSRSSALWLTTTSANPIGVSLAAHAGVKITFGRS